MTDRLLPIGELAATCGVSRDTIRYYERLGLLPRASRTPAGYRQFSPSAISRVRLVRNAVRFGFSLEQLSGFLGARDQGSAPCRRVRDAANEMLADVERQIAELSGRRDVMRDTLASWDTRLAQAPAGAQVRLLDMLAR